MQNAVVPDRFLAFAFGAGDILIELDSALKIVSVDGALALIDPSGQTDLIGQEFQTLLLDDAKDAFSPVAALSSKESFRFGPISIAIGAGPKAQRRFCVFANKVLGNNRIFLTISEESRFVAAVQTPQLKSADHQAKDFIEHIEAFAENSPETLNDMQMTIVEAQEPSAGQSAANAILRSLSKYSATGAPASQIRPGQFAVLHPCDDDAPDKDLILADVEQSTGLSMSGVSLTPAQADAPDPAVFLHTLRDIVVSDKTISLAQISEVYQQSLSVNIDRAEQFRRVLRKGAFSLAFQPIVSLKDRTIHHYEALTRFNEQTGFENAFETIKFAEQTGVIAEFDLQVIWRVFKEIEQAQKNDAGTSLAVNVSGNSLNNPHFLDKLLKTLARQKKQADFFQLEITESFQIDDLDALAEVIKSIQAFGYSVCLDDFGAGASGFQYLRTLPVDCVKIDGPYIRDAMEDKKARAFLKAMVGLCSELEIQTVAEWIENEEQHDCLLAMGATYGQGFLYGPATALPENPGAKIFRGGR